MNDKELKERLQASLQSRQEEAPEFDATWDAAKRRYRASKARYRRFAGVAAIVASAVVLMQLPDRDHRPYLTEADLMSSTQWLAPSDVLLPKHEFDLYGELPVLIDIDEIEKGSPL